MKIFVTDHAGVEHELEALEGWRVMEVIRDWNIGIKAECGGACACATCHVYVDPEWVDRLIPMSDEEEERLDDAMAVKSNSRLSCQLLMSDELDGLRVRLAPGSEPEELAA
ncbi:2Fe-2S iron-sulfur cluster-binding protein [Kaistia defluvii]|uniref:2Fe-2S iron-sulfur cluster-binding protein n=1 Tax=Kaistia defluvii TaxID=410841 RepID=UPI002255382A|nr:2Fe-2S iron-sulfur cluster-binding protein [Kaistia defluvii]MCX5518154.1 2Fe-2S iron-sulfur cluster-binding protein [Kaistia defluvii]